jgi:hypothetical protein
MQHGIPAPPRAPDGQTASCGARDWWTSGTSCPRQHTSVRGRSRHQWRLPDLSQGYGPRFVYLWARLTPPVAGALLRATLATGAFFGARPPVDLRAVCFVLRRHASAYFSTSVQCCCRSSPGHLPCVLPRCLAALLCTVGCGVMMTYTDGW